MSNQDQYGNTGGQGSANQIGNRPSAISTGQGMVLQKHLPSSQIPRFNPHGYQPEAQEKRKEAPLESYSPLKRKKKPTMAKAEISKQSIEELLLTGGVEYRNPEKVLGGWLPLEAFDDTKFDSKPEHKIGTGHLKTAEQWCTNAGKDGVDAQGLWRDKDGLCYWRKLKVTKFRARTERYDGYWENTKEKCRLHRIFVLFDEEDPVIFASRFKAAFNKRIQADALLKYNYYIENMPKHQIPEVDNNQVGRVLTMTQNSKGLRGKSSSDTTTLLNEVNIDFAKTMNKIIFDKHLCAKGNNLITGELQLPEAPAEKLTPYFGMITIPPHNFPKQFSKYCCKTLQIKDEVIRAQQDIRKECNEVAVKDVFNPNVTKTMKVDEFNQIQASSISQASYFLKETWVNKIKEIIKASFTASQDTKASTTGAGASAATWFNLNETNREAYEQGKLKKFLTQTKFIMQDTLLDMTRGSVKRYVDSVLDFLPLTVNVKNPNQVQNMYYTAEEIKRMGAEKVKFPLFRIDLQLSDDNKPEYSHEAAEVCFSILKTFEKGLSSLSDITQLEQKLLPGLFKSSTKMFLKVPVKPEEMPQTPDLANKKVLPDENAWVYEEFIRLRSKIFESVDPLADYLKTYDQFANDYALDPDAEILLMDDEENPPEPDALRRDVLMRRERAKKLQEQIPESIVVSMFQIDCKSIRTTLADKHLKIAKAEVELIAKQAKIISNGIMAEFDTKDLKIIAVPNNIEELSEIKSYMSQVPNEIEKLGVEINKCTDIYDMLNEFQYAFEQEEDADKRWRMFGSPQETIQKIARQNVTLDKEREKFVAQMQNQQAEYDQKVHMITQEVAQFIKNEDINAYEQVAVDARDLWQRLSDICDAAKTFNQRESLTDNEETSYEPVFQLQKDFRSFYDLWTTIDNYRQSEKRWRHDDFELLDPEELETTVDDSNRVLARAIGIFRGKSLVSHQKMAEKVKEEVLDFRQYVGMAMAMRTTGIQPRHWTKISSAVGFDVKPFDGFNLQWCIDKGMVDFSEAIEQEGNVAQKEYTIETQLAKMKLEWESVGFSLKEFKTSGTFLVGGWDEAYLLMDDHIMIAQAMQFSQFKGPFVDEIEDWYTMVRTVQDVCDEWNRCQGNWSYLWPVFDSPDIMKQLVVIGRAFRGVDKSWREILKETDKDKNIMRSCNREGLLAKFLVMNENLEMIQRGLRDYLGEKRGIFARFYFLSDEDLLSILSETKEVRNVRPHLKAVFENMNDLKFEVSQVITKMYSAEKEEIELVNPVDPNDKKVEFWMGEIEDAMYMTVREVLKFSVIDYKERPRNDWIKSHPGQCVLNGSQIHWTTDVENGFKDGGLAGITKIASFLDAQLLDTVSLVSGGEKLDKLQRLTLGALIVIDVHAKDVTWTLVNDKIDDPKAFEWMQQLRYYWENDDCRVKCIQTNYPYGYEYLGNTLRLVITPLTDKCYMTLMGALQLNIGGAPAGPAGTGKTESTKDLAKGLAKQCVVFNCSDTMEHTLCARFFKGLAASGSWCCFDEFNRINVEVLSVIAMQLQILFGAKDLQSEFVDFEGSHIAMKPTFCVFITMNPGYAGRNALPDNLNALFRPVAMMVPDYALIGKILMYSFGYIKAEVLSIKMVTTFKLASEQLSTQCHYDYGMRAVRSTINAAGRLIAETDETNEDKLLLRALLDVNVPKFLNHDLPLFANIIEDLFPGVGKPDDDYGKLTLAIEASMKHFQLINVPIFYGKIIQLYDTCQVRHGLMLVGPSGGGKTNNYACLQHAMSSLEGDESGPYGKVQTHILNPKCITSSQLYGDIDPGTGEWDNGIAQLIVENCSKDESPVRHWVIFDGPVDAIWIESMNTVLDDNKKLCLTNGSMIGLTSRMTIMFEVEDLEVASPATVSRCGMIYMEPEGIGLKPLFMSWMRKTPPSFLFRKTTLPLLETLYEKYIEELVYFVRWEVIEPVITVDNNLVASLGRILDCFFFPYRDTEVTTVTADQVEELEEFMESIFIYAITWSIGITCDIAGRKLFDAKLRELVGKNNKHMMPDGGEIYDYCYFIQGDLREWRKWADTIKDFSVPQKAAYADVIVPTTDSIRMKYLMKTLLQRKTHYLCAGPTGTGKTINIAELLGYEMDDSFNMMPVNFSAQTSALQTQNAIDERMEKRRKGVFGPPPGTKCAIFVDDLNMPKKETYGAQPPLELIRQWFDHKGYYELKSKEKAWTKLEDVIFVAAMGPPGGGREKISMRIQRHFNLITYTELGADSISTMFQTILKHFLHTFEANVQNQINDLVECTLKVYNDVGAKLRPRPSTSHYLFNLRDISGVIQGVCGAYAKECVDKLDLVRLWYHENIRIFGDRLVSNEDRDTLDGIICEQVTSKFKLSRENVFITERLSYGDWMDGNIEEIRPYKLINDLTAMLKKVEDYLEDYNSATKSPMNLVMFLDACDHVARISRILRQPMGNALLLGVGGSGRQSLCRLATSINAFAIYQITVIKGYTMKDWRENLKTCLLTAGTKNKQTVFLLTDTQITQESMTEDMNGVLNAGDVPQLYKLEDQEEIIACGRKLCTSKNVPPTKTNMVSQYITSVKQNIHCVIAMSPMGEVFQTRLRMFPSLINCCTIDWFTNWPAEALLNVAKGSIGDDPTFDLGDDKDSVIEMFKIIHQSVELKVEDFWEMYRRRSYVTPTSYLELLATYKKTLTDKRAEVSKSKRRLERGLKVLAMASTQVAELKEELTVKQPALVLKQGEIEVQKVQIAKDTEDADKIKAVVTVDKEAAEKDAAEVKAVVDMAEAELAKALPMLADAIKKVDGIDAKDFYELKGMAMPSAAVVTCFKCVVLFLLGHNTRPTKPKADSKLFTIDPEGFFVEAKGSQQILGNPTGFLKNLKTYDKDNMPEALIEKIKPILEQEEMSEKKVKSASSALANVRVWIVAMVTYYSTLKIVNPMRETAKEMNAKLKIVMAELNIKLAEVAEINAKLDALNKSLADAVAMATKLGDDLDSCKKQLYRAEKMIVGLQGEKDSWTETVAKLGVDQIMLTGDCLIASGALSYNGPFISKFREELEELWRKKSRDLGIKFTEKISMRALLGNPMQIRQWNVSGLPGDNLSVENGIIMFGSRRWPLMIDPQTQANKFIKNLGKVNGDCLNVLKQSDKALIKNLEISIPMGKWVLIENIGESIDPSLEPILLKNLTKTGTQYYLKLGDKSVQWSDDFKFYLTTTLPNPHYSPETSVKVSILNFAITPSGLEEQMLNRFVQLELPEMQEKKNQIVEENAKSEKVLFDIESKILGAIDTEDVLSLLLNDDLVNILDDSAKTKKEISERQEISMVTEKEIDKTRALFLPVSFRASLLFFAIVDLNLVDPMYQYSLQWFQRLFANSVRNSEQTEDPEKRVEILNDFFTTSLYQNVCRSLFERHKLMFSVLLCTKILFGDNQMDNDEWRFFLSGAAGTIEEVPNPTDWLEDLVWIQTYRMLFVMERDLPAFKGIVEYFREYNKKFKKIFDSSEPQDEILPGDWSTSLNSFQKIMILQTLRADGVTKGMQNFVIEKIGKKYVDPPPFALAACFGDSGNTTPLIFVLSSGTDPNASWNKYGREIGMDSRMATISLGSGQQKPAENLIEKGKTQGMWVLLQNCHLLESWLPRLEQIVDTLDDQIHPDFRLWMTSMPTPKFPVSALQNSVKMTLEPPSGIRSNLIQAYQDIDDADLNSCKKPEAYKKMLFALCFFHAIVQDRRKFGGIGWNIPYAFTNEDYGCCKKQLKVFLNDFDEVPFKVLNFLVAEINYGGRVTDYIDGRLIFCIISRYFVPEVLTDDFYFSETKNYRSIPAGSQADYVAYIKQLPLNPQPEAFGMHENAQITTDTKATRDMLETVLSLQPRATGGTGMTRDDRIAQITTNIQSQTPEAYNIEKSRKAYPTDYHSCLNTVLTQELIKYNALLIMMKEHLINVKKALIGEVVMSDELDKVSSSLHDNQVPLKWASVGFLSLKPLASWIIDLNERTTFLQNWLDKGAPPTFWISGFFFPQAFFTATLQNYARKCKIAIDELDFDFKIYDEIEHHEVTEKPEDGSFGYGMFFEGARWNSVTHCIDESQPKQLYSSAPMILFLPRRNRVVPAKGTIYRTPMYKVLSRSGTLSTTGHSTNFCLWLEYPTRDDPDKWVRAGVAIFLALLY